MRVLDLFSGIGGFSLGLRMAGGFETVQFVEIEPFCRAVLKKNFPRVPIHDDIRTFGGVAADVICGGFPCQPFSSAAAGKRKGTADDRFLWPEMRRVISAIRPAWVIGENVAQFDGMGLEQVVSDMEALGYQIQTFEIPACAVGHAHRRNRLWIVGYTDSHRKSGCSFDAEASRLPQSRGLARGLGKIHGLPRRMDRLRGLGNAVVPQVVSEIGKAIMESSYALP